MGISYAMPGIFLSITGPEWSWLTVHIPGKILRKNFCGGEVNAGCIPLVPRNPCFSTGHLIIKGYYKVISEVRKDCILLFPKFLLLIQLKWNLFEAAHLQPFICQHNLFLAIMMSRWRGFCRDKSRKPRMNGRVEEESNQNRRLKFFFCLDHKSKSVLFKNAKVDLN